MKKSIITVLMLSALSTALLCGCGKGKDDQSFYSYVENQSDSGDLGDNDVTGNIDTDDSSFSNDYQSTFDQPMIRIDVYDEKHADFVLDVNSIIDVKLEDLLGMVFHMPSGFDLEFYPPRGEDNKGLFPDMALIFSMEYGGLGTCEIEKSGSDLIAHMDFNSEAAEENVPDFSFMELEGECSLFYNPPEGTPEEYLYSHEYMYDWASITNDENFSSLYDLSGQPKNNANLVGVWATEESDRVKEINGEFVSCMVRDVYIFYPDGTWLWERVFDSRDDSGYQSVDDNLQAWIAANSTGGSNTYSFDGEKINFKPSEDYHSETTLEINGDSFTIELDYGRYLAEDGNMQCGTYTYYSGL